MLKTLDTPTNDDVRWQGVLEGLHEGFLYGWAVDMSQPNARVVVEICLDGEAFGCVIADVARTDITLPLNAECDVCHGFVADLGLLATKESGVLTARIANAAFMLPGHVHLDNPENAPLSACSQVFSDGALRLYGWALHSTNEARPVEVYAYLGADRIAFAIANLNHPAIRSLHDGPHGFTLELPLSLADGSVHEVRVVDERGQVLNGSPVTICVCATGVKALLSDADQASLLSDVIDSYERYLPRSLGLQHYPAWCALFESSPSANGSQPQLASSSPTLRFGVIVTGEGDQDATLASLDRQQDAACHAFVARVGGRTSLTFRQLLQQALDEDVDVVACIRAGDTLPEHALASVADGFALKGACIVYTDSAVTDGAAAVPWFKPAWNPEYALGTDYPLELMATRAELARTWLEKSTPVNAADNAASFAWSMLAEVWEQGAQTIVHVPRVLYHFNAALTEQERAMRLEAARFALRQLEPSSGLDRMLAQSPPDFTPRHLYRVLSHRQKSTSVSLIIPTRDRAELLERCISSIQRFTEWENLEIIVVDNDSVEPGTKACFDAFAKQGIRILSVPGPFNFATLNNRAVEAATGDIIGLINNDIEPLHSGWLDEIIGHLLQPGVGAVGAKLLWPNGMVQHGGVLMGVGAVAGHYGNALADTDWGDHGRNQLTHQVSGVTAACLFMRRSDYQGMNGMDPIAFPVAFNDVDLCLKLRRQGKAIIWTPHARLLHAESASRGREDTPQKRARAQREIEQLRKRWGTQLLRDPAYHPSLNLDAHAQAFGGLALPPRARTPRRANVYAEMADADDYS